MSRKNERENISEFIRQDRQTPEGRQDELAELVKQYCFDRLQTLLEQAETQEIFFLDFQPLFIHSSRVSDVILSDNVNDCDT